MVVLVILVAVSSHDGASRKKPLVAEKSPERSNTQPETSRQRRTKPTQLGPSQIDSGPRIAADAYLNSLQQQGIVFGGEFRTMINYKLSPRQTDVIYTLDYVTRAGFRRTGPYTITVRQSGNEWEAVGGTPGDRSKDMNTNSVIGKDGQHSRSPLEQQMAEAMGR
jgi:hypothetical protein